MRKSPVLLAMCVAGLICASVVVIPNSTAAAFPQDPQTTVCSGDIRYLIDTNDFDTTQAALIVAAIERWNIVLNDGANSLLQFTRVFSDPGDDPAPWTAPHTDPVINITRETFVNPATNGVGICGDRALEIAETLDNSDLTEVIKHEMGHIIGLGHTGKHDDLLGTIDSAMSTCQPSSAARDVGIDDWGQARQKQQGPPLLDANPNFESSPTIHWRNYNLDLWSNSSNTIGSTGNKSLYIKPTLSTEGYVYSLTNFASSAGSEVVAALDHRMLNSTTASLTGNVRLDLFSRMVTYAASEVSPACEVPGRWRTTKNQNDRVFVGNWIVRTTKTVFPIYNTWIRNVATPAWTVPGSAVWTSLDLRVQVSSTRRLTSNGITRWIMLDNVEIREN